MVNGLSGRRSVSVARPVVEGRNLENVPAPTHPPQEAEKNVRGKTNRRRTVTLEDAQVKR